jgi:DUF1009 family protein
VSSGRVALIAGGGSLPEEFLKNAKEKGVDLVVLKFIGETGELDTLGFPSYEVKMTALSDVIKILKKEGIKDAIMLGYISHFNVFRDLKFDMRTVRAIMGMKDFRAASIMGQIIKELGKEGIKVLPTTYLMQSLLAGKGNLTRKKPDKAAVKDIGFGLNIARKIAGIDIGQTVVIKRGGVIAVEAQEGTDACIERGGSIGGPGFIVVKVARPSQDLRYDVPVIGLKTVELIHKLGGRGMAVQAGCTFVLEKDRLVKFADKNGIFIYGA